MKPIKTARSGNGSKENGITDGRETSSKQKIKKVLKFLAIHS